MDACEGHGKLYVYFLKIAREVIYKRLHEKGFPNGGKAMYQYLEKQKKLKLIENSEYLSNRQKQLLLPKNGIIDPEKLDVTMYAQICIFLGYEKDFMLFMIKTRNALCHPSMTKLKKDLSDEDFDADWKLTTDSFIHYHVDHKLLDKCKEDILKK